MLILIKKILNECFMDQVASFVSFVFNMSNSNIIIIITIDLHVRLGNTSYFSEIQVNNDKSYIPDIPWFTCCEKDNSIDYSKIFVCDDEIIKKDVYACMDIIIKNSQLLGF